MPIIKRRKVVGEKGGKRRERGKKKEGKGKPINNKRGIIKLL